MPTLVRPLDVVGTGAYGTVYSVEDRNGDRWALKEHAEEHDGEDLDALFRDDRLSMRGSGDAFAGFGRPESEFSRRPPGR